MKRNISRITEIVKLKQMTRKWRYVAFNRKESTVKARATSPNTKNEFPLAYDSDNESPPDVPEGYLAVYVGKEERTRFIIPTSYLSRPAFRVLLDKAEEEFGFDHQGAITIPCDRHVFERLLSVLATDKAARKQPFSLSCREAQANVDSLPEKSFC